jgi:hypothetical protein
MKYDMNNLGKKVRMIECGRDFHSNCFVYAGTIGEIVYVRPDSSSGYYIVKWDGPYSCCIQHSHDKFEIINKSRPILEILNEL